MSTHPQPTDNQTLSRALGELRSRIRFHVAAEAVLCVLVFLGIAFWGGLLLDWFFEPAPNVRLAIHVAIALVVGAMFLWWGVRRWAARLPDRSLALLVERYHPELAERLTTAVDLNASPERAAELHPELVTRTQHAAAEAAAELDVGEVLDRPRLHRFATGAIGLMLSIVFLALVAPQVWKTYKNRIALSPDRWPRSVQLSIAGFEPDGDGGFVRKVARNSDVPILVEASLANGLKAPGRVIIRYRWDEGQRGRDDLVRIGSAEQGRDAAQRYEYLFERITGSVDFDIRGGDDRLRRLRIEVVERPKVTELQFQCNYPDYLNRADRTLAIGPRVELPEGTRVQVTGKANKPIDQVEWQVLFQDDDAPTTTKHETSDFAHQIYLQQNDAVLEVALLDTDGIRSGEPFRVTIASKRDQTPQLLVDRQGIGIAVTPHARLPLQVSVEDDYDIDSAWINLRLGEQELPQQAIVLPQGVRGEVVTLATIDLREIAKPQAGQRLTVEVAAADHYNFDDKPREGRARAITFEIVTEEELMARLSGTEQNLRQTFEAVADKLLVFYDSLDQLEAKLSAPSAATMESEKLLVVDTMQADNTTGDAMGREADRLAENVRQMADEILGVAAGFEDIHAQLFNNRIENSELSDRIGNRIAAPLRELGSGRMKQVEQSVAELGGGSTIEEAKSQTRLAIAEVEQLLREMQGLENYNEVIATLRQIIRQQQQITGKTKDKQKDDLRDLLLD